MGCPGHSSVLIYLDHHATTPCDARVVAAMLPYFAEEYGNAASRTHAFGWRAAAAVEKARAQVAELVGADPREVVFTSGATEANNLALLGGARGLRRARGGGVTRVITCATEHRAVLDPLAALEREGFASLRLPVAPDGRVDPERLRAALAEPALLVSIMHANNEIGVVQPIEALARLAAAAGAAFHCDAAQSASTLPLDLTQLGVDFLSLSAHKLYGPKGVGALVVRRGAQARLEPILHGGGHERGLRSGTLPVALCVGFGAAAELARERRDADARRLAALRDRLLARLEAELPEIVVNGSLEQRLPGNLNVSFLGAEGEALLAALPELALSTGSACTSAKREASHVLRALGADEARALSALRFGLGRGNGENEIERAAELVIAATRRLRALSPVWDEVRRASRPRAARSRARPS
ncbi:MAG TPA: aminotransferase class V-fold PLP-dependent enzyme [Myxococcota bacterium]|nr:aminotransferase class V-fold PLP-dependent enzyme [Myxococcota bacterium]